MIVGLMMSCKKEVVSDVDVVDYARVGKPIQEEPTLEEPLPLFGDPNKDPELYIPRDEGGWITGVPGERVGLYNAYKRVEKITVDEDMVENYDGKFTLGEPVTVLGYECLIANGQPGDVFPSSLFQYTNDGTRDWVVDRSEYSNGTYKFNGYLQIVVYKDGKVVGGRKKEDVYFSVTDSRIDAPLGKWYGGDTMYLPFGKGDKYFNTAIIARGQSNFDGKYVIAATIAPYGNVPGDDPSNNTSLLPFSVVNGEPITDVSAISANAAGVPTNIKAVVQRGREKGVVITWEGDAYAYCVERDGQMIAVWQNIRSFYDPNGSMKSDYRIVARNQEEIPDAYSPVFKPTRK